MTKRTSTPAPPASIASADPNAASYDSLKALLESMESRLNENIQRSSSTTIDTFDERFKSFSAELTTKVFDLSNEVGVLSTDIDEKVSALRETINDDVQNFVDVAMTTARTEWNTDISSVNRSFTSRLFESESKMDTQLNTFSIKMKDLENLNLSDSQILEVLNGSTLEHVRNLILSPVVDEIIARTVKAEIEPVTKDLAFIKASHHPVPPPITFSTSTGFSTSKFGFHQVESKDFNVSKFILNTDKIKLSGDLLVHLEHFWDSILRVFNTMCTQNQVYPCYRDLQKDFDFSSYLCHNPRLASHEQSQAKLNFRAFGSSLRLFLLDQTTITKATSPRAFLKLLSLKSFQDGFRILRDLIFKLSPQLDGTFIDFSTSIAALTIINGEHISEFYSRAQELAREIDIANLPDGNAAALLYHFLVALRRTNDPTILGLTNVYWSKITAFRRNPTHFTSPKLPWELHDVFNDLETSEVSILSFQSLPNSPTTSDNLAIEDYAGPGNSATLHAPFAAYGSHPRFDTSRTNCCNRIISSPEITFCSVCFLLPVVAFKMAVSSTSVGYPILIYKRKLNN